MKAKQNVKVRRFGEKEWASGVVELASANGKSLLLSGDELPMPQSGVTIHSSMGQVLTLLQIEDDPVYMELITGEYFEVMI